MRHTMPRSRMSFPVLVLVSLYSAACGGEAPDEQVAESSAAIMNGTEVSPEQRAIIKIDHSGLLCTGTLLRNDVVLTARHCVSLDGTLNTPADTDGSRYTLTMGSQTAGVSEVISHATLDAAILVTNKFFVMANVNTFWSLPVYAWANDQLLDRTLNCFGYGNSWISLFTQGGAGPLRHAAMKVIATTPSEIQFSLNGSGAVQLKGDSGGTCISPDTFPPTVTGIMSYATPGPGNDIIAHLVGPQAYRGWANSHLLSRAAGSVHRATTSNIVSNWTTLDHVDANGRPSAVAIVTPNWNPPGSSGVYLNKNIGVWYTGTRWAVFNQDLAAMPAGEAFNVSVGAGFVHKATSSNIVSHITFLDHPSLNGKPNAIVQVTPNYNPGGSGGVYDNHPIGVYYTGSRWAIFNQDFAAMPVNAAFNVRLGTGPHVYTHVATAATRVGHMTYLDHPDINGRPTAMVFATANWNPSGNGGVYNDSPIGVWYDSARARWSVFNQDFQAMPDAAAFNIMIRP